MVRNASGRENQSKPDPEVVLDALADDAAQAIVKELAEPMTASELSDACDIPLSTTYRKLELLTDAALLSESTEIRRDGQHTTRYSLAFEEVRVRLTDNRDLTVEIEARDRGRDERLAELWKEVQEEA
ncbi:Transcriptional regulator containing HTH domain,ArsR family [Halalkaliarchaeum sp. AArc-CO]|uniref:helix-turn-helix domain-containing protein n=1 Tax=unclassified Halalkaliarchaeum TaxID=2678344 RepID=UPI00217CF7AA|nr:MULTISPECIES: helix-turn-helix domain-containing protein [unclassified Halalkaliarchaeum]MDR5671914.1 helix-turn-helix domain-containing protein [Halalkaliarchaeum sp. AArc-GB]UWG51418.1 Transcriptional regulator containing HTH domain,ArsR family [Halalkaliarchaeum sp. AArc-CO]